MTAIADPPADLRDQGRALWADIQMRYHLDPAEEAMLRQLCRVVDEIDAMMTAMEAAPFVVPGSHGQLKAHPLIREIREHRKLAESLCRTLALPMDGERVGRIRSANARAAANARWGRGRGA